MTPSLVPCGFPPIGDFRSDRELPIPTACDRLIRNALIELISGGSILELANSVRSRVQIPLGTYRVAYLVQ